MAETFKCPHCGALHEVTPEKSPSDDRHAADCKVCGRSMDTRECASTTHYELIRMPNGSNV